MMNNDKMTAGKVLYGRINRKNFKTIACCYKKQKNSIPSLPQEIIFCILVWLPADILYNSMRYVCRQWYNIIQDPCFIKEQRLCSTAGLLIQHDRSLRDAQFVELRKMNKAKMTEICFPFSKRILDTCDGLVLFVDGDNRTMHIANPLTKQRVSVSFPLEGTRFSLACAQSTRGYKVVCTYRSNGGEVFDCSVATLGKDQAWRLISSERLSDPRRELLRKWPYSIAGFIYWAHSCYDYVIALDMESEILYEIPSPAVIRIGAWCPTVFYTGKGKSLCCMVQYCPGTLLDVWVLSDPMSSEWRMLHKIDFDIELRSGLSRLFKRLFSQWAYGGYGGVYISPIAWVNNGEVLVFRADTKTRPFIALNIKTRKIFTFGRCEYGYRYYFNHSPSLVSLTPC